MTVPRFASLTLMDAGVDLNRKLVQQKTFFGLLINGTRMQLDGLQNIPTQSF